jgi:hypothetical protein
MSLLSATVQDGRLLLSYNGVSTFEGLVEGSRVTDVVYVSPSSNFVLVRIEHSSISWRPTENLLKLTEKGAVLWRSELPTYSGGDCYMYVDVSDDGGITATSWSCYRVKLDADSGRIIQRVFTK